MATCEVGENEYDRAFEVIAAGKHHTFDSFECEIGENEYDRAFEVIAAGKHHTFDSFECAIHALGPRV